MSIIEALKKLIRNRGGTPAGSNIAEVIANYANDPVPSGGGGTIIVESVWVDEGRYDKYFKTIMTADDIVAAFTSGQRILFHVFKNDGDGFRYPDTYIEMLGHMDSLPDSHTYEKFEIPRDQITVISFVERTQDGYIALKPYID